MFRLLAAAGPVPGDEAAARLGWTAERWFAATWAVWGTLMDVTGKGWVLTAAGRAMLAANAGGG